MQGNNYREQILARLDKQDEKGMKKYGTTLEGNTAGIIERLNHLAEELVDGLRYVEWAIDLLQKKQEPKSCTTCRDADEQGTCGVYSEQGAKACRAMEFVHWVEKMQEQKKNCTNCSNAFIAPNGGRYCNLEFDAQEKCTRKDYCYWKPIAPEQEVVKPTIRHCVTCKYKDKPLMFSTCVECKAAVGNYKLWQPEE